MKEVFACTPVRSFCQPVSSPPTGSGDVQYIPHVGLRCTIHPSGWSWAPVPSPLSLLARADGGYSLSTLVGHPPTQIPDQAIPPDLSYMIPKHPLTLDPDSKPVFPSSPQNVG